MNRGEAVETFLCDALSLASDGKLYSSYSKLASQGMCNVAVIEKPNESKESKEQIVSAENLVRVYPNPIFTQSLTLFYSGENIPSEISVCDLKGYSSSVVSAKRFPDRVVLDTSSWPDGQVYMLRYKANRENLYKAVNEISVWSSPINSTLIMRKILHWTVLCGLMISGHLLGAQTITPVYEVHDVAEFDSITYNLVMYDGSPWIRKTGNITPNGGTTLKGPTLSGTPLYYERQFTGNLQARWFGIKGDGVTDSTIQIDNLHKAANTAKTGVEYDGGTYLSKRVPLRAFVSIYGKGSHNTIFKPLAASNDSSLFYLADAPVQNVEYTGFRVEGLGSASPSQSGICIVAFPQIDPYYTGGLWYSRFTDVEVKGFAKYQWYFRARDDEDDKEGNDLANQFLTFINCKGFAQATTQSRALYAIGQFGQVQFINCEFDGSGENLSGATNIEIYSTSSKNGTDNAYDIKFTGLTCQSADIGLRVITSKVVLDNAHFERCKRQVWATRNSQIVITNSEMYSEIGTPESNYLSKKDVSYIAKIAGSRLSLVNNIISNGVIVGDQGDRPGGIHVSGNIMSTNDAVFITDGVTFQASVDSATRSIRSLNNQHVLLNGSNRDLITITSQLGNADELILRGWESGYTRILENATNGNITLGPAHAGQLILRNGDVATFKRSDLGGKTWILTGINVSRRLVSGVPTAGAWFQGEIVWNKAPNTSSPIAWVCTTSGSPGTWDSLGLSNTSMATASYSQGQIASGNQVFQQILVPSATIGSFAMVSFSTSLEGVHLWAEVIENGKVNVYFRNDTGSNKSPSGTIKVKIQP